MDNENMQDNQGTNNQQGDDFQKNNQTNPNSNYQDYTNSSPYVSPPMYQQQPPQSMPQTNVLAIVGMILGILSIPASCFAYFGTILGIPGLICSILSRKKGKGGIGIAGIICSIIGIILGIVMTVVGVAFLAMLAESGYGY